MYSSLDLQTYYKYTWYEPFAVSFPQPVTQHLSGLWLAVPVPGLGRHTVSTLGARSNSGSTKMRPTSFQRLLSLKSGWMETSTTGRSWWGRGS